MSFEATGGTLFGKLKENKQVPQEMWYVEEIGGGWITWWYEHELQVHQTEMDEFIEEFIDYGFIIGDEIFGVGTNKGKELKFEKISKVFLENIFRILVAE